MSRSSNQHRRKRLGEYKRLLLSALAAVSLPAGFLASPAHAVGYVYQQHIVNAGVLVNGSNPAPYLFYVLNKRPDIRPTDMTLVNPLASASADPQTAAYWEVSLNNLTDSQLSQYNVLYLRADGISFGPVINERLRRFVDNGGQLIVEYGAASSIPAGLFTGFGAATASSAIGYPAAGSAILRHPVISQPYLLSSSDFPSLGAVPNLGTPPFALTANASDTLHSGELGNLFSPVLTEGAGSPAPSVVAAAQIGAGQVVVSTLNIGLGISVDPNYRLPATTGPLTFNPANLYAASAPDLKLLANILTWSETHPNQNKSSHGNASNAGLASFSPAWKYPVAGTATPSGAAVWGNFVFVTDAAGTLHAFDAYPSENLTGTANTLGAEQVTAGLSTYPTSSYDQIWNASGLTGASAPTLAAFNGANYVFVEKTDGSVVAYNAVTGGAGPTLTAPSGSTTFSSPVPAPTYYDGRVYAGQADGTLVVYDLNEGAAGIKVTLDPNTVTRETVTGPPSVGILGDGDTSVIVAVVPTNYNVYSVLLGARNEPLKTYVVNGGLNGYSINRLGRYDLTNIFADTSTSHLPPLLAYDYNGNIPPGVTPNSTAPSPQDPLFALTNYAGYATDWDMDFASASGTSGTPVDLNFISAASYGALSNSTPTSAAMSAPVIDRHGDFYYTETNITATGVANSYVVGVHNAPLHTNAHIKFRFLMPAGAVANEDQVDYTNLSGYQFVGAPVVDDRGNVYAVATNVTATAAATKATVLCFRGDQQITAIPAPGSPAIDLTQSTITQPDEGGSTDPNTIQRGPDINVGGANATYGQFIASAPSATSPGDITFYNFGKRGRSFTEIAGNLTEPQTATATDNSGANTTATLLMRTNLAWYVTAFPVSGSISGLSLVGSSLFLTDGTALYKLPTTPQVGAGKLAAAPAAGTPLGMGTAGLGAVGAPPSVGGSVMVVSGKNGIAALTRQVTVIADNNRILGVDGDGSAVWSVDATTRTDLTTGVETKVAFTHPTALSQFALNDYLVADPGTNRCVRFDSGSNVQWELTRFQDPYGLLGTGQPLTLNQPTSVVTRRFAIPLTATVNPGGTITYYLVADSGNDRILEVADTVDVSGNLVPNGNHILTWVSHTEDRDGRHYRYGSAAYYPDPATLSYTPGTTNPINLHIAATVTNLRVAPLVGGKLGPASGDAPGGSIVVFNYPATVQPFSASAPSDLAYTTAGFYAQAQAGGAYTPFTIRNPRFLQLNAPPTGTTAASPVATIAPFDFVYADDNGAFDLSYDAGKGAFIAGPDRLQFTGQGYQAMTNPAFGVTGTLSRSSLPFIPTCIQALGTDTQTTGSGVGGTTTATRRYLITQSYSQGELGAVITPAIAKLGGEVFEVDVTNPPPSGATSGVTTPGGFGGNQTLSHPALTGPLTQPTFGVRLP